VRRYGQVIGFATRDIAVGDHVHTQNLGIGELQRDYEFGTDVRPVDYYPPEQMRHFDGFKREDGRVGTRNYVAIVSTVNCSASVSQFVKDKFRDVQRDYPSIDGVLAITHKSGCGTKLFGEDHHALQRVLAGYAKHPNVAAYILIGLGCEVNQAAVMVERQRLALPGHPERRPTVLTIQETGGHGHQLRRGPGGHAAPDGGASGPGGGHRRGLRQAEQERALRRGRRGVRALDHRARDVAYFRVG
jgi:arabinonate dehydratase